MRNVTKKFNSVEGCSECPTECIPPISAPGTGTGNALGRKPSRIHSWHGTRDRPSRRYRSASISIEASESTEFDVLNERHRVKSLESVLGKNFSYCNSNIPTNVREVGANDVERSEVKPVLNSAPKSSTSKPPVSPPFLPFPAARLKTKTYIPNLLYNIAEISSNDSSIEEALPSSVPPLKHFNIPTNTATSPFNPTPATPPYYNPYVQYGYFGAFAARFYVIQGNEKDLKEGNYGGIPAVTPTAADQHSWGA